MAEGDGVEESAFGGRVHLSARRPRRSLPGEEEATATPRGQKRARYSTR